MDITVNIDLIATQDYQQVLLQDLADMDVSIKLDMIEYKLNPSSELKEELNKQIQLFNSELKHYRNLFPKVNDETNS